MTFAELQNKLVEAMKEKNRVKKTVIADMVACAKNMAIEKGCKDNITEEITDAAILKSKKICQEQIDTCPANRPDLLEAYTICMGYINELAPKMMSAEEIRLIIREIIKTNQVTTKKDTMPLVMTALKGKAEGKVINMIVTEELAYPPNFN